MISAYITPSDSASITLIDPGASSSPLDVVPYNKYGYPAPYRAPEVVMDKRLVTGEADIWALGCVIYRIIIGMPLFAPEGWGGMDETNMEQIVNFVERLGPLPDSVRTVWLDSDLHLTSDGLLKNPVSEDERDLPLTEAIREDMP